MTHEPLGPDQYGYVATRAWWTCHIGTRTPEFAYLAENLLYEWVPADHSRDRLLVRELSGRLTWLRGSAEEAAAAGVDPTPRWPTGRWRAPCGDFYAADTNRDPGALEASWQ